MLQELASSEIAQYTLTFSRITIILLFIISFGSKVTSLSNFETTIQNFRILPARLSRPASLLFVLGEFIVVLLLIVDGQFLQLGFLLGALILIVFSIALSVVLRKGERVSCNCFGASENPVSSSDIWRNAMFLLWAVVGFFLAGSFPTVPTTIDGTVWFFLGIASLIYVLLWINMGEFIGLLKSSQERK